MDSPGKPLPKAALPDPLTASVPLFDPAQMPLRTWCAGSREDPLTGLITFPDFHSHIPRALAAALAEGELVGLAIGDVDGLKEHVEQANATDPTCYGHLAGNQVMARLGAATRSWFHTQPWQYGCAATFGGDEVIIAATLDNASAFHRAVAELRDRLADELPVRVSFALTVASTEHLPANREQSGWKHVFTDALLAATDKCLFATKSARRARGGEGGVIAVTQPPLPGPTAPARDPRTLLPLPAGTEQLHVLARPLDTGGHRMLLLPCTGPAGLRGKRLRVTHPDGRARTAVAVSMRGQAAISIPDEPPTALPAGAPGIALTLQPIRERADRGVPDDLAAALDRADLDWAVLPGHEQAQMLHLITESATTDIRTARITATIDAVATRTRS
ncbi:GGDEF domain-containing protein [Streptomyces sp. NPDC005811]|uniref:GGDEF domain-containing protein n=1 Tax=Streptomyces sp. NPDC005811 TaxID=3154565 RepID=UPI0033E07257